jgi:hypothetical protein
MSLTRCASCAKSGVFAEMLHCIVCREVFCRGVCHVDYTAGRWTKRRAEGHAAAKADATVIPATQTLRP